MSKQTNQRKAKHDKKANVAHVRKVVSINSAFNWTFSPSLGKTYFDNIKKIEARSHDGKVVKGEDTEKRLWVIILAPDTRWKLSKIVK